MRSDRTTGQTFKNVPYHKPLPKRKGYTIGDLWHDVKGALVVGSLLAGAIWIYFQ